MNDKQIWGDSLPSDVLHMNGQPVPGRLLDNGQIQCGGCGSTLKNSDMPGLKPSCSFCWSAVDVPKSS